MANAEKPATQNATYVWESPEDSSYTPQTQIFPVADFNAAVKFGTSHLALYFTMGQPENAGRNFTNVAEIKDTAALIAYLETEKQAWGIEKDTLTRMFSRVAATPAEQAKFSAISSLDDAIEMLKKEPADSYFLTPSNGGFIRLEAGDKAYNMKGQQVWPQQTPPAKGFHFSTGQY